MNSYYFRAEDSQELYTIGIDLGLLEEFEGVVVATAGVVWDEIGTLYEDSGEVDAEGLPIQQPILGPLGSPWWHANLYMEADLRLLAQSRYNEAVEAGNTTLAAAIAQHIATCNEYFPLDETGEPRKPHNPKRILWQA